MVLYQNYPNPFNHTTLIRYNLPVASEINLSIYNLAGQKVDMLVNEFKTAGEHTIIWKPEGLSAGMYFYKIQIREISKIKKLILLE